MATTRSPLPSRSLSEIAKLDGPLQDDAATALGKIGDKAALATLAEHAAVGAERRTQPAIAAAICLMGTNCSAHIGYLEKTLTFADTYPGYQDLLRGAAAGLGNISPRQGHDEALRHPVRRRYSFAGSGSRPGDAGDLGLVALRNTPLLLKTLQARHSDQDGAVGLVAEAFDMLEEDLEEERFFVTVRRESWAAPDGSPVGKLCELLINKLDF